MVGELKLMINTIRGTLDISNIFLYLRIIVILLGYQISYNVTNNHIMIDYKIKLMELISNTNKRYIF